MSTYRIWQPTNSFVPIRELHLRLQNHKLPLLLCLPCLNSYQLYPFVFHIVVKRSEMMIHPVLKRIKYRTDAFIKRPSQFYQRIRYIIIIGRFNLSFIQQNKYIPIRIVTCITTSTRAKQDGMSPEGSTSLNRSVIDCKISVFITCSLLYALYKLYANIFLFFLTLFLKGSSKRQNFKTSPPSQTEKHEDS